MGYILMIIYPIGFLLTLTFFKHFGKRIGFDYDRQHDEETWYDDWDSNAQAYLTFSLGWFVVMPILIIVAIWAVLNVFAEWYINKTKFP